MRRLIVLIILIGLIVPCFGQPVCFGSDGALKISVPYIVEDELPDSETLALFHFENSVTEDVSGNTWTLTQEKGTPDISGTFAKFGTYSLRDRTNFETTSNWSMTASNNVFDFGTGEFNVEFFILFDSATVSHLANVQHPVFYVGFDGYRVRADFTTTATERFLGYLCYTPGLEDTISNQGKSIDYDTWHHLCFERTSSQFNVYIDGDLYDFSTNELATYTIATGAGFIGRTASLDLSIYYHVDELIIRDTAQYNNATTIAVPTRANGKEYSPKLSFYTPETNEPLTGMTAWYDASDESTITSSGGAVSQWNDKSGNNVHLTTLTGTPLTASDTLNSLNTISFDGTSDMETSSLVLTANNDDYTIFAVFKSSNSSIQHCLAVDNVLSENRIVQIRTRNDLLGGQLEHAWWTTSYISDAGAWNYSTANQCTIANDGTATIAHTRVNGVEKTYDHTNNLSLSGPILTVGARPGVNNERLTGYIAEVIIYDNMLTSDQIVHNETYLKNKWGL